MDCQARYRIRRGQHIVITALSLLVLVSQSGCQVLISTLYALRGQDKVDCEFKNQTNGDSLKGKDKKVIVLCTVPDGARAEYGGLNYDIITNVTRELEACDIRVAHSQKVATWLDDHASDLSELQMAEVSKKFKANYVILINLTQFSFREPSSPNLYRGRAHGFISTFKTTETKGKSQTQRVFHTVYDAIYPGQQPIPADQEAEKSFQLRYVQQVSKEISLRFHDHRPEDMFQ